MTYSDPEKRREYARAHYIAHLEEYRERRHAYYVAHREEAYDRVRAYRAANPTKVRGIARQAYAVNREKECARKRAYYAANPQKVRARKANLVSLGGKQINLNTMPPELKDVLITLKQARQTIRQAKKGALTK